MDTTRRQQLSLIVFCALGLALYVYGVSSVPYIPNDIVSIALPLDFMVWIPLIFYLLVIRPRNLSLLAIIPAIWAGYGLSAFALGSPDAGILPYLLTVLVPIEIIIAAWECLKIAKVYKLARASSADPMVWFKEPLLYLIRKDVPASMAAAELSVWYYALLSWRKKPSVLPGESAFTYHNAGGYMNMMFGLALVFPVEIVCVHILISQWNMTAASIVTVLSIYAAIWFIGDTRARVMRPVSVSNNCVHLKCGIRMEATIPLPDIEKICFSENEVSTLRKADKLNYATFYQANIWVVGKRPLEALTIFGKKRVRAIGLSIDDPRAFANAVKMHLERYDN